MVRDKRYMPIKVAIENGLITEFQQLFDYIPMSKIAEDIEANYERVKRLKTKPELLTHEETFVLSDYIQIAYQKISELVYNQFSKSRTKG
jgi:hypothetical protein